jgi:hypothetical protein
MAQPTPVQVEVGFFGTENALRQMSVLQRAAGSFGSQLTSKLAGTFGAVALGAMAFNKVNEAMQKNIATAKQVSSLAIKFNMDPKQVHSVKMAADDAGVSVRALLMASKALAKAAEQGGSNRAMMENWKQLGFTAEKVNEIQAKPMKFLPEIAEKLSRIGDENERNAAGALLLGRQYQQLAPLIDKLGESEEAREKFLNNQNALTKEEVEMNKEIARINSQMEESLAKFAAAGAGIVSWSKQFASNIMDSVSFISEFIKQREKLKTGEATEAAGQVGLRAEGEVKNLYFEQAARNKKKLAGESLTNVEAWEEKEIERAGGIEKYMAMMMLLAQQAAHSDPEEIAEIVAKERGEKEMDPIMKKHIEWYVSRLGKDRLEEADKGSMDKIISDMQGSDSMGVGHDTGVFTVDGERQVMRRNRLTGEFLPYHSGSHTTSLGLTGAGQDMQGAAYRPLEARGAAYMASSEGNVFKSMLFGGGKFDQKTGKFYSEEEYAKLQAARAQSGGKDDGGALSFEDARAKRKREKEAKKLEREFDRSERAKKVEGMSPVEKAQDALANAKEDVEIAKQDLVEKEGEGDDARQRITDINAAKDKFYKDKEEAQKAIEEREKKEGRKLTDYEKNWMMKSKGVDASKEEELLAMVKSIANIQKELEEIDKERLKLKINLNKEQNKEVQAADALRQAEEGAYMKEVGERERKRKDDADFEKEERGRRHDEMRRAGRSDLEIKQDNFQSELTAYEKVVKNKEELENEINARRAERAKKGLKDEYTDAEKAQLNAANESVDASRKSTDAALKSMEDEGKPTVVASDLGRAGGGAVVQFGANNPADLIRKSNEYLAIIAKNSGSKEVAKAKDMVTTSFKRAAPATK